MFKKLIYSSFFLICVIFICFFLGCSLQTRKIPKKLASKTIISCLNNNSSFEIINLFITKIDDIPMVSIDGPAQSEMEVYFNIELNRIPEDSVIRNPIKCKAIARLKPYTNTWSVFWIRWWNGAFYGDPPWNDNVTKVKSELMENIASIMQKPNYNIGKKCNIKGKVIDNGGLPYKLSWYEVDDGSGSIIVILEGNTPEVGEIVDVIGTFDLIDDPNLMVKNKSYCIWDSNSL